MIEMNRRDMTRFEELNKIMEKGETQDGFSLFTDDVTEDLKYK